MGALTATPMLLLNTGRLAAMSQHLVSNPASLRGAFPGSTVRFATLHCYTNQKASFTTFTWSVFRCLVTIYG